MRLATEFQEGADSIHALRIDNLPSTSTGKSNHENSSRTSQNGAASSEEYSAVAARATNDAVRDWHVKSGALSWPQGLENLLGYPRSATTDAISFWQKHIHPDDRARIAGSIRDALAEKTQDRWTGEYRFRREDGEYADLLERALIVRENGGVATRFVGSLMDNTARKQLQDQLCRAQKMEAFGQLAGGVAHDFNNFLTTILGYSDLLLGEMGIKGTVAQHVGEIRGAAGRASALTAQLLAFSRKHPLEPRVLEVNALIANIERSLLRLLGENIWVVCHLHQLKDGAHIKVDPGQLTQILLNLVVNARDAMTNGGQLTLETDSVVVAADENTDIGGETLAPGKYVTITVSDDGTGMSEEVRGRLFEPFFTTKENGVGGGLGLATSYGILRQSGGNIAITSELGKGTTARIFLPQVSAPPAPGYKRPSKDKSPTGTETILVLEDDIGVRHLSVRVLRSLGYQVLEAANSDDAQRAIQTHGAKQIDLLLTDMVMPHMSGRDFADSLRKTRPHTKVVFISGYLEESLNVGDRCHGETFFLPKPFDPEQLAKKIRDALDSKKTAR